MDGGATDAHLKSVHIGARMTCFVAQVSADS